jgi:hypothetical protein
MAPTIAIFFDIRSQGGWEWLWFLLIPLALAVPLVFPWKHRLSYAASLSTLVLVGILALWLRNRAAQESFTLRHFADTPTEENGYFLGLKSYGSGLGIWYSHFITHDQNVLNEHRPTLKFEWFRGGPYIANIAPYPEIEKPLFNHWGFALTVQHDSPRPKMGYWPISWSVVVPIWFPIPFLLLLPWRWAHVRFVIPRRRRRQNRCLACGYLRHGIPLDRACPECGSVPTVPSSANAVVKDSAKSTTVPPTTGASTGTTAAETQEKA